MNELDKPLKLDKQTKATLARIRKGGPALLRPTKGIKRRGPYRKPSSTKMPINEN